MKQPSSDVLNDLCMRFVLNCPDEELRSFDRMLFQVEQAHWFYEDHVRREDPDLQSFGKLQSFVKELFEKCSVLKPYKKQLGEIVKKFNAYKQGVPTRGAIILDPGMEHCLLLRGYKSNGTWGFPKGKVNENESDLDCAVREVYEETSYDIRPLVKEEAVIDMVVQGQSRRMYIARGVDRSTSFSPQCAGEVGNYAWMPVSQLPTKSDKIAQTSVATVDGSTCKFYGVWRFTKPLRAWIKKERNKDKKQAAKAAKAGVRAAAKAPKDVRPPPPQVGAGAGDPMAMQGHPWLSFRFDRQAIRKAMEC